MLRRRAGLTQLELGILAGVGRRTVQRIEHGAWANLGHEAVRRVADALGAHLRIVVTWNGEQLDRLLDAGHADLANAFAAMLRAAGWLVAVEVSFNHYGDRGRYDILAYHPASGVLLVVEIKTAIGDAQATLGSLDVKLRLAAATAREQGWSPPAAVVPALVIADDRQQHRLIARHAALFSRFELRGRGARAWLRRPDAAVRGLLLFLPMTNAQVVSVRKAMRGQRVRRGTVRMTNAPPAGQKSSERPISPS